MRDESNVIAFTLALKFAFIVINFSLVSSAAINPAMLRHQENYRSCPHGLLPENVLRSDV
jgi:hypothetical protein